MEVMSRRLRAGAFSAIIVAIAMPSPTKADIITDWNQTATSALVQARLATGEPTRALAVMHAAIFEAVNSIEPRFAPYRASLSAPAGSSALAAASAAAYRVLVAIIPAQATALEARHKALIANIPESPGKAAGLALGEQAAAAILSARAGDGADYSTAYSPRTGAGIYALTSNAAMASPLLGKMKPFVLATSDQVRPPPPPPLDSAQALRDLDEVKVLGQKASATRTSAQTDVAAFHVPAGFLVWNSIARAAVEVHALNLVSSARAMALVNFATMDAQIAILDAKFTYNGWRPRTAINAEGPAAVRVASAVALPSWEPFLAEPMHPEYPCAHCGVGAAAATVMEGLFGSGTFHFAVSTGALGGTIRPYSSFRQFEEEEAISRIYGGVHFRWSNLVGEFVGKQVGKKVLESLAIR
jgi:hypothetical protein